MNGEPVCCCTSQLWATASIQLPTLLTSAPIQIQRKARWRRTPNMKRRLIAEPARSASQRRLPGVGEPHARDSPRHPHLGVVLRPPWLRLQRLARPPSGGKRLRRSRRDDGRRTGRNYPRWRGTDRAHQPQPLPLRNARAGEDGSAHRWSGSSRRSPERQREDSYSRPAATASSARRISRAARDSATALWAANFFWSASETSSDVATPARYDASTCACALVASWACASLCCSTAFAAARLARAPIQLDRARARAAARSACARARRAWSSWSCAYRCPRS